MERHGSLMVKPRTPEEFSQIVTSDFTWRLRELSSLKLAISSANPADKATFIRSLVVMCYARWEGHAKYCGDRFLDFLTMRKLKFSEINGNFYAVRFFREINSAYSLNYESKFELVSKILSSSEDRFSHFPKELVDTRSNLNSDVLCELCLVCGLNPEKFSGDQDFIDRILLKRRNEIAHGEAVFVDAVDVDDLINRTAKLMRTFRDELDNIVILGNYRAAA